VNEKPEQIERQNKRGRMLNLLLNTAVLLLLGAGIYLTVKFGLQLLDQHFSF